MVDTEDLKSSGHNRLCGFESRSGYDKAPESFRFWSLAVFKYCCINQKKPTLQPCYLLYLAAIDEARGQKIDGTLYPQPSVFKRHFAQSRTHTLQTCISMHSEGRREEIRHIAPEIRHCSHRPRHAADEEQRHRHEDEEQHGILAAEHKSRSSQTHEDACQHIRQHELQEGAVIGKSRQVEPRCDSTVHIHSHNQEDRQVEQSLASYHS